jgi:septal ring factor EnvC (AmiA/AmiB activator)
MVIKLLVAGVLGAIATLLSQSIAHAAPEPIRLVEKYEESRKEIAEAEEQKRKILGSLYGINQRMKKISKERNSLNDELMHAQGSVKGIAKIISNLENQIQSQRKQLRKRLRALYKLSGEGYLAILFSRTDPQQLDQTMRFLKIVTDNDYYLIRAYQQNVATYSAQKQKLRGQVEKLISIEKNIKKNESQLLAEHNAKSKIVSGLDKEKIAHINTLKSIRHQGQAFNIGDLLQASIFEQKGQLATPVVGNIVQDFGLITDDKYKVQLSHKGWLFATSADAPVTAIFDGQVIFADMVSGYGPTMVVDHGDHYYSVYAHITRAGIKTGDTIKKGQVIAMTGPIDSERLDRSSEKNRYGLYFEIRHFSEPENPAGWIRKEKDNAIATNSID